MPRTHQGSNPRFDTLVSHKSGDILSVGSDVIADAQDPSARSLRGAHWIGYVCVRSLRQVHVRVHERLRLHPFCVFYVMINSFLTASLFNADQVHFFACDNGEKRI